MVVTKTLPKESPQILAMREDFRLFLFYVFQYLNLGSDPTEIQYDLADYLQSGPKRSVIEAFRGVGKTLITGSYAAWRVWNNPNIKVLIVSGSGGHAKKIACFVRDLFAIVPVLKSLEPGKTDVDIADRFNVSGIAPAVQPTFSSIGLTGQLQGQRANLLIADDVETQMNSYTVHQREKLWEIVKEFDSILNSDEDTSFVNRIVYLGTPQTEETLYTTLARDRGYSCRVWTARVPASPGKYRGNLAPIVLTRGATGFPVDPQRFNEEELIDREMSYGRSGFARQFMLDPELGDAERFPLKLADLIVSACDYTRAPSYQAWSNDPRYALENTLSPGINGDRFYRAFKVSEEWTEYTGSVLAIDPAGKGKDEVGYAVVKHLHGMLYVLACGGLKGGYEDENMKFLANLAKKYNVNKVICESNFGGGMFTSALKKFLGALHPCDVEDIHSSGQKEKRIIDILEPVLNQHRLVMHEEIVKDDLKTEDRQYCLFFQMTRLSADRGCLRHDDRLDALAMAVGYWTDTMAQDQRVSHEESKKESLLQAIEDYEEGLVGGAKGKEYIYNSFN